jgi:site-specific DNA-methyltransferase (adenine-specific)
VFLFSNSKKYYYDQHAITEPTNGGDSAKNRRSVWTINTESGLGLHPATFPTELVRLCILAGSRPGDVVIDPFFGLGTVGLVCQEEGRRFLGVELNPRFVKLAGERLGMDNGSLMRVNRNGIGVL